MPIFKRMYESKKSIKSQPVWYMIQFTTFIPMFKVVNVSGRYRGHFGQERNDVKLLHLEVF